MLGTLNTLRTRPVSRSGVLPAKWFVAILYVGVGLALVGMGAVFAGGLVLGFEPLTSLSGGAIGVGYALGLIALAYRIGLAGTACIVSPAVLLSTLTGSSLTAAVAALVLVRVMQVLGRFSCFDFLEPYLFTGHFEDWFSLLIPWEPIGKALLSYATYIVGLTLLAWGVFRRKDILS